MLTAAESAITGSRLSSLSLVNLLPAAKAVETRSTGTVHTSKKAHLASAAI